jgi:hypothetical protein
MSMGDAIQINARLQRDGAQGRTLNYLTTNHEQRRSGGTTQTRVFNLSIRDTSRCSPAPIPRLFPLIPTNCSPVCVASSRADSRIQTLARAKWRPRQKFRCVICRSCSPAVARPAVTSYNRFVSITQRSLYVAGHRWTPASRSARSPTPAAFATTRILLEHSVAGSAIRRDPRRIVSAAMSLQWERIGRDAKGRVSHTRDIDIRVATGPRTIVAGAICSGSVVTFIDSPLCRLGERCPAKRL